MPPLEPINLTDLTAVTLGIMVLLVPIAGLTLRFALKPFVEAYRIRSGVLPGDVERLTRRVAELEQHVKQLENQPPRALGDAAGRLQLPPQ